MLKAAKILKEKGLWYKIIKLKNKSVSVNDLMKYAKDKVEREEACKAIIIKDKKRNFFAVLLKGEDRIDIKKVSKIIGRRLSTATNEQVKEATGLEVGAVCPVLLNMPTIIDKRVFEKEKLNMGSGDLHYGLEMKSEDLKKVIKDYRIEDVI